MKYKRVLILKGTNRSINSIFLTMTDEFLEALQKATNYDTNNEADKLRADTMFSRVLKVINKYKGELK